MNSQLNIEMEAIKSTRGVLVEEHKNDFVQREKEVVVKDVWTKFFFKKNLLCFRILLQTDSGEIVLYQELKDYSEYKNTLCDLQAAKGNNVVIKIPKKIINSGLAIPKVA
ncbi:MAG: hypothetical protein R2788_15680 [Saprospiraceae bacterium]